MSEHHGRLVIRFYPHPDHWECIVQQVDRDGFPEGGDLVAVTGKTKEEAVQNALVATTDPEVQAALKAHGAH
jgi:hypothetical protein